MRPNNTLKYKNKNVMMNKKMVKTRYARLNGNIYSYDIINNY